jgi:5'-nucleotidase
MEGVLEGIPSIAFSLTSFTATDFSAAARFASRLVGAISHHPIDEPVLFNVNIPAIPADAICGVVVTKLGIRRYRDIFEKRIDPRGKIYYWLSGEVVEEDVKSGTDIQAIRDNYITITPLKYDLTLDSGLLKLKDWLSLAKL